MILYILDFLFARWKIITLLTIVIILIFSLFPINSISNHTHSDKIGHLLMYSLLTLPISIVKPSHHHLLYFFFVCLGGFIEIIQPLFNRYQDLLDFIFNTAGVLLGIFLGIMVRKKYSHLTCFN